MLLREGHARTAQIANQSSDGPGALGAPVAGLPGKQGFFEAQIPLWSSWLGYAALARATRTRAQVAKALAQLEVLLLLFVVFGAEDTPTKLTMPSIQATGLARSARASSMDCLACKFFRNANSAIV